MGMHPHDHHRHYAVTAIATGCERFKVERYKALFSSFIVQQIFRNEFSLRWVTRPSTVQSAETVTSRV